MAKNVILMVGDGMGWEMARAAAVANGAPFYSSGEGSGLNFQTLSGYTLATTYGTTIARGSSSFSTGNAALDNTISQTGESPVLPGFQYDPAFNPGTTAVGGAANPNPYAVGNLVGYDPARGGINPWTPGTDKEYIKYSYPDSANTATTLYTGVKSYNNAVGVDIFEQTLESILSKANELGRSTGLVTSVPIDHATPAAAASAVNRRNKYDGEFPSLDNILQQELRIYQPTVLLGGGHPLSTPGNPLPEGVEPNTSNEFITKATYDYLVANPTSDNRYGYTFLERGENAAEVLANVAAGLDPENGDRLFGLYGARGQNGNLPVSSANGDYSTTGLDLFSLFSTQGQRPDRLRPLAPGETDADFIATERNQNPTLEQLTSTALNVLGKDKDGFWLLVEGGDIDWSAHDNNLDNLIGTINDFDRTVKSTIDWINANGGWEDNLLIVTADHDHYFTLNPNYPELLNAKGAEALTAESNPAQAGQFWGSDPTVKYGWGNHSNRPVPVYYQGAGSETLTSAIGTGYNSYGFDVPGIPGVVDQVHIYQTMYNAITGQLPTTTGTSANDTLYSDRPNAQVYGGNGDNRLFGLGENSTFIGGSGNDTVYGGTGEIIAVLGDGNNVAYVDRAKSQVSTGNGADSIYTGVFDDSVYAGNGNNAIYDVSGNNTFTTGSGDDFIVTGNGNNKINTGTGTDKFYGGTGTNVFTLNAGAGSLTIYTYSSSYQFTLGSGLAKDTKLTVNFNGEDTLISAGDDLLATLKSTPASEITLV